MYFSRLGYVKKLACEAADETGAELYEIRSTERTGGTLGSCPVAISGSIRALQICHTAVIPSNGAGEKRAVQWACKNEFRRFQNGNFTGK